MKLIEGMTDAEIVTAYKSGVEGHDGVKLVDEAMRRLSAHPAQRIADLTGGVVTKNENGMWKLWPNDDLIPAYGVWSANFVKVEHFILPLLPDDNRPWQESIYRPKANVRNGGKDESRSAG